MNYLSVCSGVEAASVAWHPLGWKAVGYAEIEPFPSAVLNHHYPTVTNFGDMAKYKEWNIGTERLDLLVGGTPCQAFSVAGLRQGLADPRGNLSLVYTGILDHYKPKWFVWENVPGVLSSNGGRDFGSFLGALAELGYGFAYRVLDAQYFRGTPQRRRRVFVVGHLGNWELAAKTLFEQDCLSRHLETSRGKRKGSSVTASGSVGSHDQFGIETFNRQSHSQYGTDPLASTVKARDYKQFTDLIVYETHPADSRVKEMGDVCQTVTSRWGTGGGNVPIAIQDVSGRDKAQNGRGWSDENVMYTLDAAATQGVAYGFEPGITKREGNPSRFSEELCPTLRADMGDNQAAVAYSIREDAKANNFSATRLDVTPALQALRPSVQSHHAQTFIANDMAVRRLTPIECERLQGFPDDYTNIPWRGKSESPDSLRYKAMGNSMAVPCMNWIGQRIQQVEDGLL
jgi:DNA (cytosine-5)-methyltransferase 1